MASFKGHSVTLPESGPAATVVILLFFAATTGCRENAALTDPKPDTLSITYRDTSLTSPSLSLAITDPDSRIVLSWSVTPGATVYFLEEDRDPSFLFPRELYRGPLRSLDLGVLSRNRPWYFRARGAHAISTSPWSNIIGYSATSTPASKGVSRID